MHVLIVLAHPLTTSFTAAVARSLRDGIATGGTAELADLHAEGFDPRFTEADHAHFWGGPAPPDVAKEHARIERADALAIVSPVYWWSFPAMLKGWIDRIFTPGWAYIIDSNATSTGMLGNRPTIQIRVGGTRPVTYAKYGYDKAISVQQEIGIFGYCGLMDIESHDFLDVEGDANDGRRRHYLEEARRIGSTIVSPTRPKRKVAFGKIRRAE